MPTVPTQHVPKGTMIVSAEPLVASSVIGAGYAIAVVLQGGAGGGLVHIDSRMGESASEHTPGQEATWRLLDDFIARLETLGPLGGGEAEIAGGADVLRLFSMTEHELRSERWLTALSEFLWSSGIAVRRFDIEGTITRRMALTLPHGAVDVVHVGSSSGALPARQPFVSERRDAKGTRSSRRARPLPPPATGVRPKPPRAQRDATVERSITVNIGCMEVDRSPTRLVTLLGSCVGVALHDPTTRIGGLAHVMMPRHNGTPGQDSRFANTAVPALIDAMLEAGAMRSQLTAKIAGGASVLFADEPSRFHRISEDNVALVRDALDEARIPLLGEDVGGQVGRKMVVDLETFRVRVIPLTGARSA